MISIGALRLNLYDILKSDETTKSLVQCIEDFGIKFQVSRRIICIDSLLLSSENLIWENHKKLKMLNE